MKKFPVTIVRMRSPLVGYHDLSEREFAMKVCGELDISYSDLKKGALSNEDWERFQARLRELGALEES